MFYVDVLGAGNGRPGATRDTAGLLMVGSHGRVMVDCPGGVVEKLARRSLAPEDIDAVLLTHDHVDHIYGLPHLLHALAIGGSLAPLKVLAPAPTLATVGEVIRAYGLDGPKYPSLEAVALSPDQADTVTIAGFRTGIAWSAHSRPTLATRWEAEGKCVASTSDTVATDMLDGILADADVLFHDCGGLHGDRDEFGAHHASAREAGETARRVGAQRLVLTHLPPADTELRTALEQEAGAAFGAHAVVANDGDRFSLAD